MYPRIVIPLVVAGLIAVPAFAEPRTWVDDFTTLATYNSTSLLAPCYGGPETPSTKYSVLEPLLGNIVDQRALSGGGTLALTNKVAAGIHGRSLMVAVGVVNLGQPCPDVATVPFGQTSERFTSDHLCLYGGFLFDRWQLTLPPSNNYDLSGPDGAPGIANVDDDADGQTDNDDESPAARPTTVNGGYGNRNGTGYQAGFDAAPGVAGTDDDADGTTDNVGETGDPNSDDGDDKNAGQMSIWIDGNTSTTSIIYVNITPVSSADLFSLSGIKGGAYAHIEWSDEFFYGFYQPYIQYNWVFCTSGTCYGAMMWTGSDMANPDETLGPVIETIYNVPEASAVGFAASTHDSADIPQYLRKRRFMGNSTFNDTFYVISGDARTYFPPITADFDGDNDVDGQDFMKFSKCFNGSLRPPKATCENPEANFDGDIDVDGQDFMAFSKCFNGSLRRPKCLPPILTNCP